MDVDIRQVLERSAGSTSVAFIINSFYKHALAWTTTHRDDCHRLPAAGRDGDSRWSCHPTCGHDVSLNVQVRV
jgi:hypothetical protein